MTSHHKTGTHPFYIGMYIHIYTHIYVHKNTSQKECLHIFHWEIELGSEQEQILRLLRRAILDLPASSTVAGSATLELEVKFAWPLLRSRCRVWLRRLCWQISQQFLSGMVATWTGMGAVNVASSWFLGWAAIFAVVLSFSIVCFCKKIWSGMVLVSGQCFEVRLAILDGPLVVMPTPPALLQ